MTLDIKKMEKQKIKELEKEIKELREINKNQQELIVDYEKHINYQNETNPEIFKENYLKLMFLNKKIKNKQFVIETIKIPCWDLYPLEFAKIFQILYKGYQELEYMEWYYIEKIIILSKMIKNEAYGETYENQEYINQEITYQFLIEKYSDIKEKYHLKDLGMI